MPPLVSVAIRTRNRLTYLREAVESVFQQTFTDWELIISDENSSDATPDYCAQLLRRNQPASDIDSNIDSKIDSKGGSDTASDRAPEAKVRVYRNVPGLGSANNWRFCLQQSRGTYFVSLDDDNRFLPTFLESCVGALRQWPQATYAFTDEWRIDGNGQRRLEETDADSRLYGRLDLAPGFHARTVQMALNRSVGINAALMHRERLVQAGGFRELAGDSADFDVFLNLAAQGHSGIYLPERLIEYRRHGEQEGDTYAWSIPLAEYGVAILESVQFEGEEEQSRRQHLAVAYSALSRVYLMNSQLPNARQAIRSAWKMDPGRKKTLAALLLTGLPGFLVYPLIRRKYNHLYKRRLTENTSK